MIKLVKLSRPIKMGKRGNSYKYCVLGASKNLSDEGYKQLSYMIKHECAKDFYNVYNGAILFEDKSDAEYFAMQAVFIKSRESEKTLKMANVNWKNSRLYNYCIDNTYT